MNRGKLREALVMPPFHNKDDKLPSLQLKSVGTGSVFQIFLTAEVTLLNHSILFLSLILDVKSFRFGSSIILHLITLKQKRKDKLHLNKKGKSSPCTFVLYAHMMSGF